MRTDPEHQNSLLDHSWQSELEAYLREIGPTIPAVTRAMSAYGSGVLDLWVSDSCQMLAKRLNQG